LNSSAVAEDHIDQIERSTASSVYDATVGHYRSKTCSFCRFVSAAVSFFLRISSAVLAAISLELLPMPRCRRGSAKKGRNSSQRLSPSASRFAR
jgi:hypothetical protein